MPPPMPKKPLATPVIRPANTYAAICINPPLKILLFLPSAAEFIDYYFQLLADIGHDRFQLAV